MSQNRAAVQTLWILNTGAQWHMLPQCYPNYKTVHRRFQTWCRSEVLRGILMDIANELRERGVVCTENSIRVDHVSESPNVGDDDCAVLPLPGPVRLAV